MKIKLFLLLIFVIIEQTNAQSFFKEYYNGKKFQEEKMYFVIPDSYDTKEYKDFVTNLGLEELIDKYWTYSENYVLVSNEELPKSTKAHRYRYADADFLIKPNIDRRVLYQGVNTFIINSSKGTIIEIRLDDEISKVDIVYALKVSQFILNNLTKFSKKWIWKDSPKYFGEEMKEKTLLINEKLLGNITADDIKSVYPYKFKIVDKTEIENAILNQSKEYLIIYQGMKSFEDGNAQPINIIYSTEDGSIVSWKSSSVTIGSVGCSTQLNLKFFKGIVKNAGLK